MFKVNSKAIYDTYHTGNYSSWINNQIKRGELREDVHFIKQRVGRNTYYLVTEAVAEYLNNVILVTKPIPFEPTHTKRYVERGMGTSELYQYTGYAHNKALMCRIAQYAPQLNITCHVRKYLGNHTEYYLSQEDINLLIRTSIIKLYREPREPIHTPRQIPLSSVSDREHSVPVTTSDNTGFWKWLFPAVGLIGACACIILLV